jgi:two-component system sensor histidine kinase DegS
MAEAGSEGITNPAEAFLSSARQELEEIRAKLSEIDLLVEQSQGEVDKLAERNASVAAKVHQLQANFDTVPRDDIRLVYEDAQDAQQRLFTMRGQVEKLSSDKAILERYVDFLARTVSLLDQTDGLQVAGPTVVSDSVIHQIITAQEDERRKISRQIHDGPAQSLANLILQAEIATRLFEVDQDKAREELANLQQSAGTAFGQLRDFIFDLRPMMLDDLGLIPTIRRYLDAIREKTGLDINLIITGTERRLEAHREVLVFRALQDVLTNVREHAAATKIKVTIDIHEKQVRSVVEDNGRGFDPQAVGEIADAGQGQGLRRLHERIGQVGGSIDIQSQPGEGTKVVFFIPTGD